VTAGQNGDGSDEAPGGPPLVVYWRPGCGFCGRLRRTLDRAGVVHELRNIWEDQDARRFVAEHNRGNETVPTVALGDRVMTNPNPTQLVARLAEERPDLVGAPDAAGGWRDRLRLF
jgi:mycoredoxin